jgi:hypothetical protein
MEILGVELEKKTASSELEKKIKDSKTFYLTNAISVDGYDIEIDKPDCYAFIRDRETNDLYLLANGCELNMDYYLAITGLPDSFLEEFNDRFGKIIIQGAEFSERFAETSLAEKADLPDSFWEEFNNLIESKDPYDVDSYRDELAIRLKLDLIEHLKHFCEKLTDPAEWLAGQDVRFSVLEDLKDTEGQIILEHRFFRPEPRG